MKDRLADLAVNCIIESGAVPPQEQDSFMEGLNRKVQETRGLVDRISSKVEDVKNKHGCILSAPDPDQRMKEELAQLNAEIKRDGSTVQDRLMAMQGELSRGEDAVGGSVNLRIQKSQLYVLCRCFGEAMTRYNEAQVSFRARSKARIQRQLEITGRVTTNEQLEAMLESGNLAIFVTGVMSDSQITRKALSEIESRHRDIIQLESSIRELQSMFLDIALLVETQGDMTNNIEKNVSSAAEYVSRAVGETKKAVRYQTKARRRYTSSQASAMLTDSDSDGSWFDPYSESDLDEESESGGSDEDPHVGDSDAPGQDNHRDTQLRETRPRSRSPFQPAREAGDQTQQRGRGRPRGSHRRGRGPVRWLDVAGDQAKAFVNHPAAVPGPGDPVWGESEMNWQPKILPFTANPGPVHGAATLDSERPVDFVELFISDELIQNIVDQTNLYADQHIKATTGASPYARIHGWKPVTVSEIKKFLGLFFLTGIIRKPELGMYWATDEMLATPYFNNAMSRNRFEIIWRFLHFNDKETRPADCTDRLYKVRPVLDYLLSRFREMYQPNKNICIDEGMLKWRGRLAFKVYNPQKPIRYGIKSYILCDSGTGYCYNMKPYCGVGAALGDTVVFLLDRLAGHGYRLFMDNFYNSVALCERLLDLKTHVCGTLRKNRGEPPVIRDVVNADLGIGETIMRHADNVMVLAWRDKQIVKMVTTLHQHKMENVEVWQEGQQVVKQKPACIVEYNNAMNGVDRLDQNIVYYPFTRKSHQWTKKFVTYLFEISLFNAFVIYKAKHPEGKCKTFLSFIQSVVKSWTSQELLQHAGEETGSEYQKTPRAPRSDPRKRLIFDVAAHALVRISPTPKKQQPTRKCRVCARKGLRKETSFYCKGCVVPLHYGECYTVYHSKVNYTA